MEAEESWWGGVYWRICPLRLFSVVFRKQVLMNVSNSSCSPGPGHSNSNHFAPCRVPAQVQLRHLWYLAIRYLMASKHRVGRWERDREVPQFMGQGERQI